MTQDEQEIIDLIIEEADKIDLNIKYKRLKGIV